MVGCVRVVSVVVHSIILCAGLGFGNQLTMMPRVIGGIGKVAHADRVYRLFVEVIVSSCLEACGRLGPCGLCVVVDWRAGGVVFGARCDASLALVVLSLLKVLTRMLSRGWWR